MVLVRFLAVVLLILVVVAAYQPQARQALGQTWENFRPVVVVLMDSMYAAIRNLVVGNDSNDQIDNDPASPGVDFDYIVT